MEQEYIRDLMDLMVERGVTKISIKEEGSELCIERQQEHLVSASLPQMYHPQIQQRAVSEEKVEEVEECATYVSSPMVGTFYAAPSPGSAPFVSKGDIVTPDTVVCIIEAMKVMNEIKAGISGIVDAVLVEERHPVEFGTKLFKIV